jgi:hypothetical protein
MGIWKNVQHHLSPGKCKSKPYPIGMATIKRQK